MTVSSAPAAQGSSLRHRVASWQVAAFGVASACITWGISAAFDQRGLERVIGPYRVPPAVEVAIAAIALVAGVAAIAAIVTSVRRHEQRVSGLSVRATVAFVGACVAATCVWRVATAVGSGANIGAGFFLVYAPFAVAGLLYASVYLQRADGGMRRGYVVCSVLAWLVGPLFAALLWNLPE